MAALAPLTASLQLAKLDKSRSVAKAVRIPIVRKSGVSGAVKAVVKACLVREPKERDASKCSAPPNRLRRRSIMLCSLKSMIKVGGKTPTYRRALVIPYFRGRL